MNRAATWAARATALLTLATLLASCHTTRVVWAKPGGNKATLQDDMQACNYNLATTAPGYRAAAAPIFQSTPVPTGSPTGAMTPYSNPSYPSSASSGDTTKSATIDVRDAQRLAVSCMIAHGWRLTPLP